MHIFIYFIECNEYTRDIVRSFFIEYVSFNNGVTLYLLLKKQKIFK